MRTLLLAFCMACTGMACAQQISFANFNSGLNAGWTILNGGTTPDTWYVTGPTGFGNQTLNGTAFAFVNSDAVPATPARTLSEQLRSPLFNGLAYGQVFLDFDHYYRDYSTDTGWVEVFNGVSWVPVANYSTNQGAWSAPAHVSLNLTPYRNANMQVRFRYEDRGVWAWWWAVDNVELWAPSPWDASLTTLTPPAGTCGLGTNEPVSVQVRNDGTATITTIQLSYQINGGPVVTETSTASIAPAATHTHTFNTGANMATAGIYTFRAWCNLASDSDRNGDTISNVTRKSHIRISAFPYVEDFEGGQAGWFPTGTLSTWAWGAPAKTVIQGASSGTKAWTTGGLTGDYVDNEHSELEGPCFDISALASPWFGTDIWWNAEHSWDGAALQASADGGLTWTTIGASGDPYNWYNDNTINGAPGGQQNGWTGRNSSANGSGGWVRAVRSLANLGGSTDLILRLAFGTDGSVVDDGIAFDRITVGEQPQLYLGPDTAACGSLVLAGGAYAQYQWSTGDTGSTLLVTQSGTYGLSVTDALGFPSGDQIQVDIQGAGNWTLGPDTAFCGATPYLLQGPSGASTFAWSSGDTTPTISATSTGTYILTASYPAGCIARDTVQVNFSPLQAAIAPGQDTLCRGSVVQLQHAATAATGFWWDFGNGSFSSLPAPFTVYMSGGTYPLQLIVNDGTCHDTVTQWVFVDVCTHAGAATPMQTIAYPNPAGSSTTLSGEGWPGLSVEWTAWDALGRKLAQGEAPVSAGRWQQELQTGEWPRGLCLLEVRGDGSTQIVRLMLH